MPNSNEPTKTYNDIPPLSAAELGGVIARVKEGEEIIGNVPLPVPVNKGGTNATTASTARTNLGLGTIATQNANSVAITGGAISGITPLPLASGGTNSNNGSITGTGALTFTAGGTNQNINLVPSGTGAVTFDSVVIGEDPNSPGLFELIGATKPKQILKSNQAVNIEYFSCSNTSYNSAQFLLTRGRGSISSPQSCQDGDRIGTILCCPFGVSGGISTPGNLGTGFLIEVDGPVVSRNPPTRIKFLGVNTASVAVNFAEFNSTRALIPQVTESTSTTTGALQCSGGLGVAKNVNIGGNLRFAGGTVPATAASAGTTGDIRYDGSHLYICTATNTWRRTALSTW